ncbi:MAG: TolC family protein [Cyclobacteriaceae bacterium]|nr:TolC family protein [Cyclobacteriaceae bacterium SS2]
MKGTGGLLTIILLLPLLVNAQTKTATMTTAQGFTLDDCVEYAINNAVGVKNARLDQEIADAKVKETIGIGLPQIDGNASVSYAETQPRFFGQYDPNSDFFGLGNIPGIQPGDVAAAQNFFQLKGSGDASLSINQLIFNGSYIVGLQASQAYKDLAIRNYNQTEEEVILNVSKAYYNLLINKERLQLYESNIKRVDSLFSDTRAMYENGFAEKIDVDRIKVNLNNLKTERDNFIRLVDLSERLLKFQMNYPLNEDFEVAETMSTAILESEIEEGEDWDYTKRPDYQVLLANQKLQQLNIRNKYAEAMPVISAFANLGYTTQSPTFGGIFTTNSGFDEQPTVGPDKWYGYNMFGLRMSWSLFTGLQRTNQIQQEKLALLQVENSFDQLESSIEVDIQQSRINYDDARNRLEVQKENKELAQEIFEVATKKYSNGVGSNLEVIEAENSLKEADINYYNTLYEAVIAQLELKKALGLLNQQ